MIHVQIASEVTADGVRGTRWVLLEAAVPLPEATPVAAGAEDPTARTAPTAPAAADAPAPAAAEPLADSLRLRLLKALVVALGLGAALWTAAVQIGPPGRAVPAAPAPAPAASQPAPPAEPQQMPGLRPPLPAASIPVPGLPDRPAAPQSTADVPTSAPAAGPVPSAAPASAPAPAGLSRLTASL
jgi:hypothetical protein